MSDVRAILHCDLDAFYASVEQRDHSEYRGKPVIVGGAPGERGVVMAASYEARAFGVRSAMPLRTAALLCPDAIFVPGDRDAYVTASEQVMALFRERTPLVEPISLDEAFLDVTATEHLFGDRESMARAIKREVRERCGLVISVGVATNKLCAKIGSDLRKPDGLVVVAPGGEAAFLAPLAIERLWGVGVRTRELLAGWGITTIGALAAFDREALETRLGEFGVAIWERAHGIDDGSVTPSEDYVPRSVGHSHTFFENTLDTRTIESTLLRLSEGVGQRRGGNHRAHVRRPCSRATEATRRGRSARPRLPSGGGRGRSRPGRRPAAAPPRPPRTTTRESSTSHETCSAKPSPRTARAATSARSASWGSRRPGSSAVSSSSCSRWPVTTGSTPR